jgi:hypothetical protein
MAKFTVYLSCLVEQTAEMTIEAADADEARNLAKATCSSAAWEEAETVSAADVWQVEDNEGNTVWER